MPMKNASAAGSFAIAGRIREKRLLSDSSAAVMSTGFFVVAKPGRIDFSSACVASASGASGMPASVAASAVITQTAPELLIATSRRPFGVQPFR